MGVPLQRRSIISVTGEVPATDLLDDVSAARWRSSTASQQRKQLPKFEAGGDQSLKRGKEKPPGRRLFHSDASGEKPGMKSSSEATSILSERGERANCQREQKTSSEETAWKSPGMSSIAVIQHQKIGGKEIVPQEQELSDDSMRSGQMNISSFETGVRLIDVVELHVSFNQFNGEMCVLTHEKGGRNAQMSVSTRPQENVDLEGRVEDEKLCEKVDFPQGDTTVITQSVKAVYIDMADPVTAKSSSIPFQVKGDGEEVLLNANFENEIVWFDMRSAKGITPEQQAQVAEMLAEGKGMFCSKPGYTDLISYYIDMGRNLPIEVMSYTMMLHHAVTRKRNSKGRDTIVFSPEKKVSDYG
uniref:Uncharacterized protein n=1 Tax=Sphaerodactylus townsendi TaxID=933632 RepID=A0ACB8F355_9SAUR